MSQSDLFAPSPIQSRRKADMTAPISGHPHRFLGVHAELRPYVPTGHLFLELGVEAPDLASAEGYRVVEHDSARFDAAVLLAVSDCIERIGVAIRELETHRARLAEYLTGSPIPWEEHKS